MYCYKRYETDAGLAQLVEQRIRNAWVGSSSLLTGTIYFQGLARDWQVLCFYPRVVIPILFFVKKCKILKISS